jgi:hypothetical protein
MSNFHLGGAVSRTLQEGGSPTLCQSLWVDRWSKAPAYLDQALGWGSAPPLTPVSRAPCPEQQGAGRRRCDGMHAKTNAGARIRDWARTSVKWGYSKGDPVRQAAPYTRFECSVIP